jgi:adenine-specific DNA methylase
MTNPSSEYTRRRIVECIVCGGQESLESRANNGSWLWEVVLVERATKGSRELDFARPEEVLQAEHLGWQPKKDLGQIPVGQETRVLLRHGFRNWSDLYPRRQQVVIEELLKICESIAAKPETIEALRMAVLGSIEMAGHLSRWDRWYLKSYEAMAGHRFNFATFVAEPNVWGARKSGRGTVTRRIDALTKASDWLQDHLGHRLKIQRVKAERPYKVFPNDLGADVVIVEGNSEKILLRDNSVDLVLTDPPYHDDIQYSELSLPFRVWSGLDSAALAGKAVVNRAISGVKVPNYGEGLLSIFKEIRRILKADGHLVFSYANRDPEAWCSLFAALQGAKFVAVGFSIVHSENETDQVKRNVRACTLDFIMDLMPAGLEPVSQWQPEVDIENQEEAFLLMVGRTFLEVGYLSEGWRSRFVSDLRANSFIAAMAPDVLPAEMPVGSHDRKAARPARPRAFDG